MPVAVATVASVVASADADCSTAVAAVLLTLAADATAETSVLVAVATMVATADAAATDAVFLTESVLVTLLATVADAAVLLMPVAVATEPRPATLPKWLSHLPTLLSQILTRSSFQTVGLLVVPVNSDA